MGVLIYTAVFFLVALVAVLITIVVSVTKMRNVRLEKVKIRVDSETADHWREWKSFASSRKMVPAGHFVTVPTTPIVMTVWTCPQPAGFFVLYTVSSQVDSGGFRGAEFVTVLDAQAGATLTTTTRSDGLTIPPATGSWVQCFQEANGGQLEKAHTQGLAWLRKQKGIAVGPQPSDIATTVAHCVHKQTGEFSRNPLYPLIALYRFAIGRHLIAGKPVWKQ